MNDFAALYIRSDSRMFGCYENANESVKICSFFHWAERLGIKSPDYFFHVKQFQNESHHLFSGKSVESPDNV